MKGSNWSIHIYVYNLLFLKIFINVFIFSQDFLLEWASLYKLSDTYIIKMYLSSIFFNVNTYYISASENAQWSRNSHPRSTNTLPHQTLPLSIPHRYASTLRSCWAMAALANRPSWTLCATPSRRRASQWTQKRRNCSRPNANTSRAFTLLIPLLWHWRTGMPKSSGKYSKNKSTTPSSSWPNSSPGSKIRCWKSSGASSYCSDIGRSTSSSWCPLSTESRLMNWIALSNLLSKAVQQNVTTSNSQ